MYVVSFFFASILVQNELILYFSALTFLRLKASDDTLPLQLQVLHTV